MATGFKQLNSTFKYIVPKFSGRLTYDECSMASLWSVSIMLLPMLLVLPVIPFIDVNEGISKTVVLIFIIATIFFIFGGVSILSICARRLHDTGRSGHWLWLSCFNLTSIIPAILMLGDSVADNEYGPGTGKSNERSFNDVKKAFHDVFKPSEKRLNYKEFALSSLLLSYLFMLVFFVLYFISLIVFVALGLTSAALSSIETTGNVFNTDGMTAGFIILGVLWSIVILVFILLFIRLCILRLHDTGRSGLVFLWSIIPVIGVCIPLLLIFCDTDDDNKWGPDKRNPPLFDEEMVSSRDEIEE